MIRKFRHYFPVLSEKMWCFAFVSGVLRLCVTRIKVGAYLFSCSYVR